MEYPINKGAGKRVEFKGLTVNYLFLFAGGLAAVLLLVIVLYLIGMDSLVCILFGLSSGSLTVYLTFWMNRTFGEHGLMKRLAEKRHPRYLIHRRRLFRLLTKRKKR